MRAGSDPGRCDVHRSTRLGDTSWTDRPPRTTAAAPASRWSRCGWPRRGCVARFVVGVSLALSARQPRRLLALVVAAAVVIAIVQAIQQHHLMVAVVLGTLAVTGVACPLGDAALSRRDELAADRYAARAGYGPALAGALRRLDDGDEHRRDGLLERALARHPSTEQRLDAMYELLVQGNLPRRRRHL